MKLRAWLRSCSAFWRQGSARVSGWVVVADAAMPWLSRRIRADIEKKNFVITFKIGNMPISTKFFLFVFFPFLLLFPIYVAVFFRWVRQGFDLFGGSCKARKP